ncbi:MAG: pectate lyase [Promethearchaeota archaeon]
MLRNFIKGISEIIIGLLLIGLFIYLFVHYNDDIFIYHFYMVLFSGCLISIGSFSTLTVVQGIISLITSRNRSGVYSTSTSHVIVKRMNGHLLIVFSVFYLVSLIFGLITFFYIMLSNIDVIKSDLGIAISDSLEALLLSTIIVNAILFSETFLQVKRKKFFLLQGFVKKSKLTSLKEMSILSSFQLFLFIVMLLATLFTGLISSSLVPSSCYSGNHGFSSPAYDLNQVHDSPHYNSFLDNFSNINKTLLQGLEQSLWAMTKLQSLGGFPMKALPDGSEMYSDRGAGCPLHVGEFSLQGGTAYIASVYLEMHDLEPNPVYLNIALNAADALLAVQDEKNGGFYYDGWRHPDGKGYQPHPRNYRHAAVLDDNVMQSCLSFLLDVYNVTGIQKYLDSAIKGLNYLLDVEKDGGGWPQRTNYPPNEYPSYVTLNDDSLHDVVFLMLKAYDITNDERYLLAAERAGQFLIRVQGNGGSGMQQGWAQQYDDDQPAWARAFEPPAFCSKQTATSIQVLMELYFYTSNETYLDPIPAAISWLTDKNTTIKNVWEPSLPEYIWARLYEPMTNRMIVGNRNNRDDGPIYYHDYDPNRDYGYSWIGTYSINSTINNYHKLVDDFNKNITAYENWRSQPSYSTLSKAQDVLDSLNNDGFWLDDGLIADHLFVSNARALISYFKGII